MAILSRHWCRCVQFMVIFLFFGSCFFFQAEDGIRDDLVTGVQTCALPICPRSARGLGLVCERFGGRSFLVRSVPGGTGERSEERRVGKECRSRWSPYH